MDRADSGRKVFVEPNKTTRTTAFIIFAVLVLILLIVVIILIRRSTTSSAVTKGARSIQCVNDIDCTGSLVCDTDTNVCVECLGSENCPLVRPFCNQENKKCVACISSADCPASRPVCDENLKQCIQCTSSADCGGAFPICNPSTRICVGCLNSGSCTGAAAICSPLTNTCVQCSTNGDCLSPATCVGGECCDLTPPNMQGIGSAFAQLFGNYSTTQSLEVAIAIFDVGDSTGFSINTTNGSPATGSYSIFPAPGGNLFYSGYTYQVRARLIFPCGSTPYSAPVSVVAAYPPVYDVMSIENVVATLTGFTVDIATPDFLTWVITQCSIFVSSAPNLDPNRAVKISSLNLLQQGDIFPKMRYSTNWPIGVVSGQTWYIRVSGENLGSRYVTSPAFAVVIP